MYTVYILRSESDHRLYIGCTSNVKNRFIAHNSGEVKATKGRRPLVLIHTEKFDNKTDAFNRERFLKSLWSARFKKKLVAEYIKKQTNEHFVQK